MKDYNEIDSHGTKRWRNEKGQLHRLDGPAVVINRNYEWWINGQRHRIDGPAVEYANGHKEWLIHGKLHRLDGPAYESADGTKFWWVDDEHYSENDFPKAVVMFLLNVNEETAKLILSDSLFQNESF
jgi:hypothetical protein